MKQPHYKALISKTANAGHGVSGGFVFKKAQPVNPGRRRTDRRQDNLPIDPMLDQRHEDRRVAPAEPAQPIPPAQEAQPMSHDQDWPELKNIFTEYNINNIFSTKVRHMPQGVFDLTTVGVAGNIKIGAITTGWMALKLLKLDRKSRQSLPEERRGEVGPDPELNILYYILNGILVPTNLRSLKYQNLYYAFLIATDENIDAKTLENLEAGHEVQYKGISVDVDFAEAMFKIANPEHYDFLKSAIIKAQIIRLAKLKISK
jgi:hypothetical protein